MVRGSETERMRGVSEKCNSHNGAIFKGLHCISEVQKRDGPGVAGIVLNSVSSKNGRSIYAPGYLTLNLISK